MYLRYRLLHILFFFLAGNLMMHGQEVVSQPDTIRVADSVAVSDTTFIVAPDSITLTDTALVVASDSLQVLSVDSVPTSKNALDAPVAYEATDSIVLIGTNYAFLYGEADVKYMQIELQAENIQMNLDSSTVFATFGLDSAGLEFGYPLFLDRDDQYESRTMRYNFKTAKGYITDVITQQGEGYVTGGRTKKLENDIYNIEDGIYTTCDDHEHPHFYIRLTKAKMRPKKNIVTGPVYLVIEDVPLPLGLPFAFFPFSESYSSGVIFPSYGDESARGFFLRDGGYYFAINDYVDLALRGDIYTKGSWGVSARSAYRKRYKYSGNFDSKYVVTRTGDKGLPDYGLNKDFMITWSHSQDTKANPYRTFSANVNFRTASYNRNELQETQNASSLTNNKSSTVSISQRFPNKPLSLSATFSVNQNSRDTTVGVTLPDLTASVSRIFPFKRKNRIGKERWYEKINMSYQGVFRNQITTHQDQLFKANLIKDWNNAMQHTIPVSATFNLFNYINISPSFSYTERWYTNRIDKEYDLQSNALVARDTTYGFNRLYNYTASVQASTTLYGMYEPWPFIPFIGKKIDRIRHRFEPSVSFSLAPDFGSRRYGYYNYYNYTDINGVDREVIESPFSHNMYGVPGRGKTGNISFSFDNNIEMKVRTDKDSTGIKKVSLIDRLSFSSGYNLAADSFNWNNISANLRLKLSKSYTLNLNAVFDVYTYQPNGNGGLVRVSTPRWQAGKGLGRLQTTGTSFSYTFNNDTFRKLFNRGSDPADSPNDPDTPPDPMDEFSEDFLDETALVQDPGNSRMRRSTQQDSSGEMDANGYYINTFPWSLSVNYSLNINYDMQRPDLEKLEYKYKLTNTLSFSGSLQPTKNWRLNFNSTYDFENHKISFFTFNVTRNMHCFQMTGSFSLVGRNNYYMISIAASSQLLKDLKYDKRANYRDAQSWY